MVAVLLLGLSCICSPLVALVLDYNSIKSSAEVQGTRKMFAARLKRLPQQKEEGLTNRMVLIRKGQLNTRSKKTLKKDLSNLQAIKVKKEKAAFALQIVPLGFAALAISGPKSVSQFSVKDWSVPAGDTKMLLKVQKFSNAVIVALVCLADHRSPGCHNGRA
ncbi:Dickkopf-related protein 4 [Chelonia mydas]|uniref:Dickkopf-related protein 4 n=1 Tax=Chelonia mydas TaxID=8469 RepID=M7BHZ6_CHEMY|nr:Dickkopf-related protein 4 [Chelonia mydas]